MTEHTSQNRPDRNRKRVGCQASEESNTTNVEGEEEEEEESQQPLRAKNISLTPTGEKVVVWTRSGKKKIKLPLTHIDSLTILAPDQFIFARD